MPGARNVIASSEDGVAIDSSSPANLVEGNFIGTDLNGTKSLNNLNGIVMDSADNTIGGTAAGAGNLISGNDGFGGTDLGTGWGVWLVGSTATGNLVEGNLIGTDVSGEHALGNMTNAGIYIQGAPNNTIGGTAPGSGNVISGNRYGIYITLSTAIGNLVAGNLIGTDKAGAVAMGNTNVGIFIDPGAQSNTIGGTAAGAENVISGNAGDGIDIVGSGTTGNLVAGNFIGTNATGTVAIANGGNGITIGSGASDNTIGGSTTAVGNLISGNAGYGIQVDGSTTLGNILANNWVGTGVAGIGALPNAGGALEVTTGAAVLVQGSFLGDVVNQGTVSFWDPMDPIAITGNYTQSAAGTLAVDLGGTDPTQYDQLAVSGTATLAGTLQVTLVNGLAIGPFEDYEILTYGAHSGSFATVQYPSGVTLYTSYGPSSLDLLSTPSAELVTTTADAGAGSLRAAISLADAAGNPNRIWIAFDIPLTDHGYSGGAWTITLASALPTITAPVILDGTTQPGFAGAPIVVLAGTSAGASASGLTLAAGAKGSTIRGLVIDDFGQDGVSVQGTGITIAGNFIGVDATGTTAKANAVGIDVSGANDTIGGTAAGSSNVISGNTGDGVDLDGAGATGDVVAGNFIGTDAAGSAALANGSAGVAITGGASNNLVGPANVISGNAGDGVSLSGGATTGNVVEGNFIGTDTTGEFAIGNAGAGVNDLGAPDNTIGGSAGGARNVLSGNAEGVIINGPATGILVAANLIGTDATGTIAIGNTTAGISVTGASGVTIGGPSAVARNIISGNRGDGVDVEGDSADVVLQGNDVGVDQTGTQPLGNAGSGISIDLSPGATIGGTASGAGNVISANAHAGISLQGSATSGAAVLGNLIGTDQSGLIALGNKADGVDLSGMSAVTIGGPTAGARNVISANVGAGIGLLANDSGDLVQGNFIGTDSNGANPLGNGTGVLVEGGSANNTIGGTATGAGNTIADSAGSGVDVAATAGAGNTIRWNSMFGDAGPGIVVANPGDAVNYPVFTSLTSSGGTTNVSGTFAGAASTTYLLDFYVLSSFGDQFYGEGRYLLGSSPVTTDGSGNASFSFAFPTPAQGATYISATATDPNGNTSQFAHDFGIDQKPTAIINYTTLTVNEGVPVPFDGTGSLDPQGSPLTYSWTFVQTSPQIEDDGTATGATTVHTFRSAGTFTVTLKVDDGFGGESTATASITVNDVPPAFVPRAFTPPVTFSAPTPGDGFGASVASVAGNAAIGAPFDDGPSSSLHPGAVFLYDGVPTDDGRTTLYAYGALIHVFADPNPAAGDEFGAAIATVGNDLLIGAPGSSLTGPGDGAAYLFDADPNDPNFGDLAGDLHPARSRRGGPGALRRRGGGGQHAIL